MHRLTIIVNCHWSFWHNKKNSIFRNKSKTKKAVDDWTCNYNEKYGRKITDVLQIRVISMGT